MLSRLKRRMIDLLWLLLQVDCTKPESRETCKKYQISGVPALFYFKDGKKTETYKVSTQALLKPKL